MTRFATSRRRGKPSALYIRTTNMDRKRSIGICDQTWSALLIAVGGPCGVRSAFR